jgi:hypothetical protein
MQMGSTLLMPYSSPPPGDRCKNRAVEWLAALLILSFALTTLLSPRTLDEGSFMYITYLGFTPLGFAAVTTTVGLARVFALYFNGYGLPWSARVRAVGAILGALVFALMGLSLAYLSKDVELLPLWTLAHFILSGFELYSCMRAGADVYETHRRDAVARAIAACDKHG